MDMFEFIETNEWAIVESQGLRRDWYEITGAHYDGYIYYLDICACVGSEAALTGEPKYFEAEMSEEDLLDAVAATKGPQRLWNRLQ